MDEAAGAVPRSGDHVRISTDPADLDIDWIHETLSERAYWALGRSRESVVASMYHRQGGFEPLASPRALDGAPIGPAGWQVSRCYTPAVPGIERTVVEPCPG